MNSNFKYIDYYKVKEHFEKRKITNKDFIYDYALFLSAYTNEISKAIKLFKKNKNFFEIGLIYEKKLYLNKAERYFKYAARNDVRAVEHLIFYYLYFHKYRLMKKYLNVLFDKYPHKFYYSKTLLYLFKYKDLLTW